MASRVEAMFAETRHHYKIRDGERFGLVLRRVNGSPVTRRRLAVRKSGRENEDRSAKRTRIRLIAQRGGARREIALAGGAAPELNNLEFLLANAFATDGVAAAVGTFAGWLVRVRCGGRSKR